MIARIGLYIPAALAVAYLVAKSVDHFGHVYPMTTASLCFVAGYAVRAAEPLVKAWLKTGTWTWRT